MSIEKEERDEFVKFLTEAMSKVIIDALDDMT